MHKWTCTVQIYVFQRSTVFCSYISRFETIGKVKRHPSEWEKIIANEEIDKGLISKIYKQLLQLNSRKINDPIKNAPKI